MNEYSDIISIGSNAQLYIQYTYYDQWKSYIHKFEISGSGEIDYLARYTELSCGTELYNIIENGRLDEGLETIIVPDEITKLGGLFSGSRFRQIIANGVEALYNYGPININVGGEFYRCLNLENITIKSCKKIERVGVYSCPKLVSVVCDNVEIIGESAFVECNLLKSITLSNCLEIKLGAFENCYNLSDIDLSRCEILGGAFSNCSGITNIDLKSAKDINNSFYNCENLVNIYNLNTVPYNNAFFVNSEELIKTHVTGNSLMIKRYDWKSCNRYVDVGIGYELNIKNNNRWIKIALSSDNTGQLKFYVDENILACHLTDDLDPKYTAVFVCADGKWYQFKE